MRSRHFLRTEDKNMDAIVNKLNNRYLVAILVLLFLVGVVKRFTGR